MRISDWSSDVCSSDLWIYVERDALAIGVNRRIDVPLIGDLCDVLPQLQKALEGTTRPRPPQLDGWVKQHAEWRAPFVETAPSGTAQDSKSEVEGKSVSDRVDFGGCRIHQKSKG